MPHSLRTHSLRTPSAIARAAQRFDAAHDGLWSWSGPPVEHRQGWKVHVNVSSTEVADVLRRAGATLARFPHKIPGSIAVARKLESGRLFGPAAGKLITVYPGTREHAIEAIGHLADALAGVHGPLPDRDRRHDLGSAVSYRFGGIRVRANGVIGAVPVVTSPDGSRVPDRRAEFVTFPSWEPDLFAGSYGRADLEAVMVRELGEMLGARILACEPIRRGACWVARVSYARDRELVRGVAKWAVTRLTGHAGVRRVVTECENADRLPAWAVPRIMDRAFAADRAALVAEDLGDGADVAAIAGSIEEYDRLEQAIDALSQTLSRHRVFTSDLALANLRWREGRLALIDAEAPVTVSEAGIRAIMAETARQREASLASSLLGIGELGRPGPFPWLKHAVELRKDQLRAQQTDQLRGADVQDDLAERVETAALRSLDRPCRRLSRSLAERGSCDMEQASLFRGLAGLTWVALDGGSIGTACAGARALMGVPGIMRGDGGLYFGGAGIALIVALTGMAAGDDQMTRAGQEALRELGTGTPATDDLFSGLAGILVALCGLQSRGHGLPGVLNTAALNLAGTLRARYDRPARGLAHGDDGRWLAGALALRCLDHGRTRDTLASALAKSVSATAASPPPAGDGLCGGRAGVVTALIEVAAALPDLEVEVPSPADARIGGAGLCHGAAGMLLGNEPSRVRAARADAWLGDFQRRVICAVAGTARVSADGVGWIDDRTGRLGTAFMTGSGGIVSGMLRFLGAGRLGLPHLPANEIP